MKRFNPEAALDCLFLLQKLDANSKGVSAQEIHLFAYLGCLLWVYRENLVADWGYQFVGTELGAPFSIEIDAALDGLLARGFIVRARDHYILASHASRTLDSLKSLELNASRIECLEAGCASISAFSVGMVNFALGREPDLQRAKAMPATRLLLGDAATEILFKQFSALKAALQDRGTDLRLPAVVWLTALYQSSKSETQEVGA